LRLSCGVPQGCLPPCDSAAGCHKGASLLATQLRGATRVPPSLRLSCGVPQGCLPPCDSAAGCHKGASLLARSAREGRARTGDGHARDGGAAWGPPRPTTPRIKIFGLPRRLVGHIALLRVVVASGEVVLHQDGAPCASFIATARLLKSHAVRSGMHNDELSLN
jgi:hypothetical protein